MKEVSEETAIATVLHALSLGSNSIDTAPLIDHVYYDAAAPALQAAQIAGFLRVYAQQKQK